MGPAPLGGICKEEKVHLGGPSPSPRGVSGSSHNLHRSPEVLSRGDRVLSLAARRAAEKENECRSLGSTRQSMCVLACQKQGRECSVLAAGCHLLALPNLSGTNTLAPFIPYHSWAWELGQLSPGKRLGQALQRQPGGLGSGPGWVVVAIVSAYSSSTAGTTVTITPLSPAPSGVKALAPPPPGHSLALDLAQTHFGRRFILGMQRVLGCGLDRMVTASVGTSSTNATYVAQIPYSSTATSAPPATTL